MGFGRLEVLKWKEIQSRRPQGEVADWSRIAAEQSWSSQAGGVEAAEEAQRLLGWVRGLNERHRFLVEVHVLEGLSARRIAELETSSVHSVHRGLAKAMKALRTRAGIGTARRKIRE